VQHSIVIDFVDFLGQVLDELHLDDVLLTQLDFGQKHFTAADLVHVCKAPFAANNCDVVLLAGVN